MRAGALALGALAAAAVLGLAAAECPNSCSGHGTCGANDMCTCYRNWQSSDCSERTCPYGWSFTTTPQGDLNMDGDRFDMSLKPIVYKTDTTVNSQTVSAGSPILASIEQLSNRLVFTNPLAAGDLAVGDCFVIDHLSTSGITTTTTPKKFCVISVVTDNPTTQFNLDITNDEATDITDAVVYRFLETQARPGGDWESWPGYATKKYQDDGHFYMECSNAGVCDRAAGACICFDGYTGLGCGRTVCPNDCSNHGQCLTVAELSVASPNRLSQGGDVAMGSSFVATTTSTVGVLSPGDRVFLGEQATYREEALYTVGRVTHSGFDISPEARSTLPFGSTIYHAAHYNLWDADKNQGCLCDPGFAGHDCSQRECGWGADPLDSTGEDYTSSVTHTSISSYYTKTAERQTLDIDSSCGTVSGSFSLTHTDKVNREKTTTVDIQASPELSSTVEVNEPETYDAMYCTTTFKLAGCVKKVVFTPHLPRYELAVGDFIRVGQEYREIGMLNQDQTSGNYSYAFVTEPFDSHYAAGAIAHRMNAQQTIQSALANIANGKVVSATVSKRVGGTQLPRRWSAARANAGDTYGGVQLISPFDDASPLNTAVSFPFSRDSICAGDVIMTNNYGSGVTASPGPQEWARQVLSHTVSNAANSGAGGAGYSALKTRPLMLGDPTVLSCRNKYDATCPYNGLVDLAATNSLFRMSGGRYEIETDVDGDPTELVCNTEDLRAVYIASSGAYVSREQPRHVSFVDFTYGSNQPALRPLDQMASSNPEAVAVGDVIYLGSQKCSIIAVDSTVVPDVSQRRGEDQSPFVSGVTCAESLEANSHSTSTAIFVNEPVEIVIAGATINCAATDYRAIQWQNDGALGSDALIKITTAIGGAGDNRKVVAGMAVATGIALIDSDTVSIGDRVMLEVSTGVYETRTIDSIASDYTHFTVSKGFSSAVSTTTYYRMWVVGKGSKPHSECSDRGLCDDTLGECVCFRGYTKEACEEQSALAA